MNKLFCMSIFELPSNKHACHPSFARDFVDFGRVLWFCSDKRTSAILPNRYKRHPRALPKINCWWVGGHPPSSIFVLSACKMTKLIS